MSASAIGAVISGYARAFRACRAVGVFPAIIWLLCASPLAALEAPSQPFLEKNSFYLSSAGFRVRLANDPAGQKAMRAAGAPLRDSQVRQ
jgi:hypothetical protein